MTVDPKAAQIAKAADNADWQQVIMNGGPPCFNVENDGHFCFRAKRWTGHGELHEFVTLSILISRARAEERERCAKVAESYLETVPPDTLVMVRSNIVNKIVGRILSLASTDAKKEKS